MAILTRCDRTVYIMSLQIEVGGMSNFLSQMLDLVVLYFFYYYYFILTDMKFTDMNFQNMVMP